MIESTYGDRAHPDTSLADQLEGILARTFSRGGIVLIPAFAVGRAQQLVFLLHRLVAERRLPAFPVYLDSPMAIDASEIYRRFSTALRVDLAGLGVRRSARLRLVRSRQESQALNDLRGPAVIISSSGMLSGGRILHHCRVRLPHAANTLVITGYQAAGTLGRALLEGARTVRIHKQSVTVLAEVAALHGMSGHADADEILRWLAAVERPPRGVFLTHGEPEAADTLAARIARERGFPARVPEHGETVSLT